MANVDWIKIKNEYINTQTSYRKLADEYNISLSAIRAKAGPENWVNLKKKQQHKIATKIAQKTAEKIIETQVENAVARTDRISNILEICDLIIPKIKEIAVQLGDDDSATYQLRQIVQTTKDIKDIVKECDIKDNSANANNKMISLAELINSPQPNRRISDFEDESDE